MTPRVNYHSSSTNNEDTIGGWGIILPQSLFTCARSFVTMVRICDVINFVSRVDIQLMMEVLLKNYEKQVDILISKNQALQILFYLKHCVYNNETT